MVCFSGLNRKFQQKLHQIHKKSLSPLFFWRNFKKSLSYRETTKIHMHQVQGQVSRNSTVPDLYSLPPQLAKVTPRGQGLQNWTGGTLNIIKLIGMSSRFASICIKAQEQKLPILFCQNVHFFSHFLFLCLYANRCEPRVHSYQFYCIQSTSSPILKSLVL